MNINYSSGNICLQVFNEFNARKPDEMNVFKGILKNHLFIGIVGMTVLLQVGGVALFVTKVPSVYRSSLLRKYLLLSPDCHNFVSWEVYKYC